MRETRAYGMSSIYRPAVLNCRMPAPMARTAGPALTPWSRLLAATRTDHVLEVGLCDDGPATEGHVLAIADFIPPIALSHLKAPAPGSTLTWMIEMLADRVDTLGLDRGRIDAQLAAARDGYTSQSVMVWGPGGEPVAMSRQSMVVFG